MRLSHIRVQNYKVIGDTAVVPIDTSVTALVGINESGKTAILKALWKSNNAAGEEFDKQLDYPRSRWSTERKKSQFVTFLTYALDESQQAELKACFPVALDPAPLNFVLETWYDGETKTGQRIRFEEHVEAACSANSLNARNVINAVAEELKKFAGSGDDVVDSARRSAVSKLNDKEPIWHKGNCEALQAFEKTVETWIAAAAERSDHGEAQRSELTSLVELAQKGDPGAAAREWAKKSLPIFIYFSDYGQLQTRIHLPTYIRQTNEAHVPQLVRTQRALFKWSGIDPEEILLLGAAKRSGEDDKEVQRRLDKRRTLLESASFNLTGEWADWWIPGTKHQLHLTADGEYLVLNVSDSKNPFQIPFEERSQGFQWFFSFYLVFLVESERAHAGAILLLDEPGLHLHPMMQTKLVGLFDRVAKQNQILYSTHLPFLVDGNHLERVRTVYLSKEEPPKTVVSPDPCAGGDRDTLFPLQAALGYSIAQTLFLGKRTVIVEGVTDYLLIKTLSVCCKGHSGWEQLHSDVVLVPAGGTSRLMPLASIMFASSGVEGRKMLVLLDSDVSGEAAGARLKRELFGDDSGVLLLGKAIGLNDARIEDLLPRGRYVEAAGAAHGHSITLDAAEAGARTNVDALARHWQRMGWGTFGTEEKVATALWLVDRWTADPAEVPATTRERAQALIKAINGRFA